MSIFAMNPAENKDPANLKNINLAKKTPPLPMQNMRIKHGMPFQAFFDVLIKTMFKYYDIHVLH